MTLFCLKFLVCYGVVHVCSELGSSSGVHSLLAGIELLDDLHSYYLLMVVNMDLILGRTTCHLLLKIISSPNINSFCELHT